VNERLVSRYLFPLHERLKGKPTFRLLAELELLGRGQSRDQISELDALLDSFP